MTREKSKGCSFSSETGRYKSCILQIAVVPPDYIFKVWIRPNISEIFFKSSKNRFDFNLLRFTKSWCKYASLFYCQASCKRLFSPEGTRSLSRCISRSSGKRSTEKTIGKSLRDHKISKVILKC
jgi:hypothetical protein